MTDQWDGWPADGLPEDGDTAELPGSAGGFAEDGLGMPGFDGPGGIDAEPDSGVQEGFGPDAPGEPGGVERSMGVLGYGDEALDVPAGEAGFGPVEYAGEEGFGPAGDGHLDGDPAGDEGAGAVADVPVGTDPDLAGEDPAAAQPLFPEPLDLGGLPDPVDGFPWIDADLIGGDVGLPLPDLLAGLADAPSLADLFAYAGELLPAGQPGWAALVGSPDPATSTLARFWAPGG